jgi:predicted ribosomally synthesized peptide with nif11-like leader
MAMSQALSFITAMRERADLAARVEALGREASIDDVVAIGAGAGYEFSADELRAAHKLEWSMRAVRFKDRALWTSR